MIPLECKRLAEVDFPIAAVSRHAVDEKKMSSSGHPSTLHLWWARRPLASSRAMLLALLLPDPCDPSCPERLKSEARKILPTVDCRCVETDMDLRTGLLKFIAGFANWDLSANPSWLMASRMLVKAAHGDAMPLVVDSFAGGGSIPLEALRVGCDAFASDLNPVACMILKLMLEDIPRIQSDMADEGREAGADIQKQAEMEIAHLYPDEQDGMKPFAYLWSRTVRCEEPNCGAEIPLMRSFWLCRKPSKKVALRYEVEQSQGASPQVVFEIFAPQKDSEVRGTGTVVRAKATCLCCGSVLAPNRVRTQIAATRGGGDVIFDKEGQRVGGARMVAVVTIKAGHKGRHYRSPTNADYAAVCEAQARVARTLEQWQEGGKQGLCPFPDEPLPPIGTLGFRIQRYGMREWGDLFPARQKVVLLELAQAISKMSLDKPNVSELLKFCISKRADYSSSGTRWLPKSEAIASTFGRHAMPLVWDFVELNPMGSAAGSIGSGFASIFAAGEAIGHILPRSGQVQLADAADHPLPDQAASIWFTDPPYYDAIPYSDLSDFFLVWLKRIRPDHPLLQDPFESDNPLSPKNREAVQDKSKQVNGQTKDRAWFENVMSQAFAEGRRLLAEDGIGSVVFAHKTTEGWEALLQGMIRGGWTITASWPIATEHPGRLRAQESAALATSVHLICRPRPDAAPVGEWADVLRELPIRVADWIERLQDEGIRGADLVFACIGPALEIFSRYRSVETTEGRTVGLTEYLEKVWEVVGRSALEQVLGMSAASTQSDIAVVLEEDSRLTALFLWTLQGTEDSKSSAQDNEVAGVTAAPNSATQSPNMEERHEQTVPRPTPAGYLLPFDVVRRFSQPMGIDLDHWTGRIINQDKGAVRLLPVAERRRQLFGTYGATSAADWIMDTTNADAQQALFPDQEQASKRLQEGHSAGEELGTDAPWHSPESTVLDRVHVAMLLQADGQSNALRSLLVTEQGRGPEFLRLANALSALYPTGSSEKRLLDAMLIAVQR